MIHFVTANGFSTVDNGLPFLIIMLASSLIIPIVFYALRSIGLFTLAKKGKIKQAWLSWIPCLWVYVACKLIKEIKVFGSTFGKMAVVFTLIFALAQTLMFANDFLAYFPIVGNILINKSNIYFVLEETSLSLSVSEYAFIQGVYVDSTFVYPYKDIFAMLKIMDVVTYVSMVFDLASLVITISLYINLFRKYWPSHFILAAVLSIMGLFGVFVFVIRNKQPINYMEYIRSRYANYYGQNPHGPYGANGQGPYGPNGYYGNQGAPRRPDEPFDDYADPKDKKPEDPFSGF